LAAYDPNNTGNVALVTMKVAADRMMVEPARFAAQVFAAQGLPSFEYRFSYVAAAAADALKKSPMFAMMKDNPELAEFQTTNAQHASEIPYAFDTATAAYGAATTEKDLATAKAMHAYWVNFAKSGTPNQPDAVDPQWPAYDAKSDMLVDFTADGPKAIPDPWKARMDLTAGRKD
jgi:para-nitrobenzyl esterase